MKTYNIACIPGDGIGQEVIPAGQTVLAALAAKSTEFRFDFHSFDWGGDYYRRHGVMMPADGLDALRPMDAILFGSAGDPDIPDHITLWGLRLKICQGFDQYANVRPTRILPGIDAPLKRCTPAQLDWVIVRENSEGEYAGVGGRAHQGSQGLQGRRRLRLRERGLRGRDRQRALGILPRYFERPACMSQDLETCMREILRKS